MKLKKLYKRAEKNDITLLIFRKRIALYLKIVYVKKRIDDFSWFDFEF